MSSNDTAPIGPQGPSLRNNESEPTPPTALDTVPTVSSEPAQSSNQGSEADIFLKSIFEGTTPVDKLIAGNFVEEKYVSAGYPQLTHNIISQIWTLFPPHGIHCNSNKSALEKAFDNGKWPTKAAYEGAKLRTGDIGTTITRFNPFSVEFEDSIALSRIGELNNSALSKVLSATSRMGKDKPISVLSSIGADNSNSHTSELAHRVLASARNSRWSFINYGRIFEFGHSIFQDDVLKKIRLVSNRKNIVEHEVHYLLNSCSFLDLTDLLLYFAKVVAAKPDTRHIRDLEAGNYGDARKIHPSSASRYSFDWAKSYLLPKNTSHQTIQLINIFERYDPICPSVCLSFAFRSPPSSTGDAYVVKDGFVSIFHHWIDLPADIIGKGLIDPPSVTSASFDIFDQGYRRDASNLPSPSILNGNSAKVISLVAAHLGIDFFGGKVNVVVGDYLCSNPLRSTAVFNSANPYCSGIGLSENAFVVPVGGDINLLLSKMISEEEDISEEEERDKAEIEDLLKAFGAIRMTWQRAGVIFSGGEALNTSNVAASSSTATSIRESLLSIRAGYVVSEVDRLGLGVKVEEKSPNISTGTYINIRDLQSIRRCSEIRPKVLEGLEIERVISLERAKGSDPDAEDPDDN